jgi:DNA-binding NtrC family response regulator
MLHEGRVRRERRVTSAYAAATRAASETTDGGGTATVLIADDQGDVLEALRLLLKSEGYQIVTARSPAGILSALDERDFDAALIDLNYTRDTTSGREGLELLPQLQALDWTLPVIVMTAWGSVDSAVEAMRRGAWDYLEKPWDNARLLAILRTQIELGRALRKTQRLESENQALRGDGKERTPRIIAESPAMRPVLALMERVGPSDANVLITGEHGTGKELVAQWLHAVSPRARKAFVPVNMGGLSEGVFESELFGHVKGAFTDAKADRVGRFELADGGTIFLDEIGNVPLPLQSKLLRVLQTGELERVGSSRTRHVDVRVLSATNVNLQEEVVSGRFREDLLFRLNTIELHLPPLRERREDIPALAMHFLKRHAARYRKPLNGFDAGAMQTLLEHPWPGNIRELDHAVERAVLLAQGDIVRASDLGLRTSASGAVRFEEMTLEEVERVLIQKALSRFDGNVSQAAKALGLSRSALYRRLASHGL